MIINVSFSTGKWILKLCGQTSFVFVYHYNVQTSDTLERILEPNILRYFCWGISRDVNFFSLFSFLYTFYRFFLLTSCEKLQINGKFMPVCAVKAYRGSEGVVLTSALEGGGWVVNLTHRPLYCSRKSYRYPLYRRLGAVAYLRFWFLGAIYHNDRP